VRGAAKNSGFAFAGAPTCERGRERGIKNQRRTGLGGEEYKRNSTRGGLRRKRGAAVRDRLERDAFARTLGRQPGKGNLRFSRNSCGPDLRRIAAWKGLNWRDRKLGEREGAAPLWK